MRIAGNMVGVKRVVALSSLLVVGLPVVVAAAPGVGAAPRGLGTGTTTFTADSSRLRGHGELAVIDERQQLWLMGGKMGNAHRIALGDPASRPLWSHDGRWLAVTTQPLPPDSNRTADEPTTVWLVSRSGELVRRLSPKEDVYHASAAWSPRSDRLAISYTAGVGSDSPVQKLDSVDLSGTATPLAAAGNISGFAWAPNGARIVVGLNHFDTARAKWNSRLVMMSPSGERRRTVTTDVGDILEVAGWWPDGSGVLAWRDFQGSGSLAADGLPLLDVSVKSGHRRKLANTMLQYPGWLATSRLRNKVAFIAGGDRILTNGHKHLVICGPKHCHRRPQGDHEVTFDPAWAVDGQLAVVRDRAIAPHGDYSLAFTKRVAASGDVSLVRNGHVRSVAGGERASAPVWGARGAMMFVRGSSLYLLRPDTKHAHRVAGTLDSTASFYGFVSWWDSFAWSNAVADDRPSGSAQVI